MSQVTQSEHTASLTEGYAYEFEVKGHKITAWGSAWNGREIIRVDDVVVSDLRSYKRVATHMFNIDDIKYEIEFRMVNIIAGELYCTLIEDGTHLETKKQLPDFGNNRVLSRTGIAAFFVVGIVAGFGGMHLFEQLFLK